MSGELPNIRVYLRPESGWTIGGTFRLGDSVSGLLGTSTLGGAVSDFVEITEYVNGVGIRRGRTRIVDTFDSGSCSLSVIDRYSVFNPDNTASPFYGYIKPLRQVRVTATVGTGEAAVEYIIFSGTISTFSYSFDVGFGFARVAIECHDSFRLLTYGNITTVTGEAYQDPSGTRIGKILSTAGVPSSLYELQTGISLLDNDPATERSALDAIQQCESSELGAFFCTANGTLRFYDRHYLQQILATSNTPALTFDESTGVNFDSITIAFDDAMVYNDVSVEDSSGAPSQVEDATSIAEYSRRSYTKSNTLIDTAAEAAQHAAFLLNGLKNPVVRVSEIGVNGRELTDAELGLVLKAELCQPIKVTKAYASELVGGGVYTLTRTLMIQGVSHTITPSSWSVSFSTAEPLTAGVGFILGYTYDGVLGTDYLGF